MRRYFVVIGIILGALLIGCGGEDAPEAPADPVAATAEPAVTVVTSQAEQPSATAVEASATAPRPSPTSYAGGIPSPVVVSASATEGPTPAPTSTTVPAPATQPSTPTPTASAVAASPTLTPERTDEPDDCDDFATHRDAQLYFLEQGGPLDDPFGLDTDGDGIACNAETDTGYDRRSYALFDEYTPTPTQTATPTPTTPPASPSTDIWSSPERTAELNAIDWQAFEDGIEVSLINEGRRVRTFWRTPNGEIDGNLNG